MTLLQDACVGLDLSDATQLPTAARSLARTSGAVPRMEAFIGAVVDFVYVRASDVLPLELRGDVPKDPTKVRNHGRRSCMCMCRVVETRDTWNDLVLSEVAFKIHGYTTFSNTTSCTSAFSHPVTVL
jgi:hypothetical protein